MPADAATVAAYLASLAASHRPGTLTRRLAAIADQHLRTGCSLPNLAAARRLLQAARVQPAPRARTGIIGAAELRRLAAACAGDRAGLRDRALFLLLAAAGLGRSGALSASRDQPPTVVMASVDPVAAVEPTAGADLAAPRAARPSAIPRAALLTLQVEDLRFADDGLTIALADPTDPADTSRPLVLRFRRSTAFSTCPVHALEDWLRASDARFGPVFRKVDRWGNVEHRALTPTALRQILLRRGVPPARRHRPAGERRT